MAEISGPIEQYLQIIESAVYGEDMRQAIHDAIEQCYKDGDGAVIDLTARNAVSLVNSRLDVLIAGLNDKALTTQNFIFESYTSADANNEPIAIRIGNIVQLTGRVKLTSSVKIDDFGTYKKLFSIPKGWAPTADIMYTSQRFSDEYAIRLTHDKTNGIGNVWVNRYGEDSKDVSKYPITIPKDTVLAFAIVYLSEDPVGATTPSGQSEIEDARIAKDGTVYESLGAAIRSISAGDASDFEALTARVEADEVKITTLETDNTSNKSRLSTLETAKTSQGNRITALESDNTSNKSRLTALEINTGAKYTLVTNSEIDTVVGD